MSKRWQMQNWVTQENRDMMKSFLRKMKLCYTLESALESDDWN